MGLGVHQLPHLVLGERTQARTVIDAKGCFQATVSCFISTTAIIAAPQSVWIDALHHADVRGWISGLHKMLLKSVRATSQS